MQTPKRALSVIILIKASIHIAIGNDVHGMGPIMSVSKSRMIEIITRPPPPEQDDAIINQETARFAFLHRRMRPEFQ